MIKNYDEFINESSSKYLNEEDAINNFMENHLISKYTINKDFSVDVDGDVTIMKDDVVNGKLPIKFRKVSGNFICDKTKLTSLEGCPEEVGGNFYCFFNKLTSLNGCPKIVGGEFDCSYNKLTSLDGCPKEVGGEFCCSFNKKQFTEDEVKSLCNVEKINVDRD